MSADSFIAYFGLRFEIAPAEIEAVERRSDTRMVAARNAGLQCYWGSFDAYSNKYLLFIGRQLGIFGAEDSTEASISLDELHAISQRTHAKLAEAGFDGIPTIHLCWKPDF